MIQVNRKFNGGNGGACLYTIMDNDDGTVDVINYPMQADECRKLALELLAAGNLSEAAVGAIRMIVEADKPSLRVTLPVKEIK